MDNISRSASRDNGVELRAIVTIYWRQRRIWIASVFVCLIIALLYAFLATPKYKAVASLLPSSERESFQQFGMLQSLLGSTNFPLSGTAQRSDLFPDILESRSVLDKIILADYTDPVSGATHDLYYWLDIPETDNNAERVELALREFDSILEVLQDPRTGIVRAEVITPYNWLSADLANMLIAELDLFNREHRISKAKENRIFIQSQVAAMEDSLTSAEERLKVHYERNINIDRSPALQLIRERLTREVEKFYQLYLEMFKQLKAAEIDEFKDVPVISVLDTARIPQIRHSPKRALVTFSGALIGFILGIVLVFTKDVYHHNH